MNKISNHVFSMGKQQLTPQNPKHDQNRHQSLRQQQHLDYIKVWRENCPPSSQ